MQSNSKLTRIQKEWYKEQKASMSKNQAFATQGNLTVFVELAGPNTAYISTSVASPDEKKLRKSVGEYNAMRANYEGRYIVMPRQSESLWSYTKVTAQSIADEFAIAYGV